MAPSNMFSYLRPHHKRNAASPHPQDPPVPSPQPLASPPAQASEYFTSARIADNPSFASSSPVSPGPPILPPIPRIASRLEHLHADSVLDVAQPQSRSSSPLQTFASPDENAGRPMLRPAVDNKGHKLASVDESRPLLSRPRTADSASGVTARREGWEGAAGSTAHAPPPTSQSGHHLAPPNAMTINSLRSRSQTSLLSSFTGKASHSSKTSETPSPAMPKMKSRLNLRNPMSLLLRRRSGQNLEQLSDDALVSHRTGTLPAMPDDYDPRIRGHIVHDFSAPRPKRNAPYNNASGVDEQTQSSLHPGRVSPTKADRQHTPVFREHFDDNTSYEASQAAIRAEQLVNHDFLSRNSFIAPPGRPPPPPPPPPAPKRLPPAPPLVTSPLSPPTANDEVLEAPGLSPVQEAASPPNDQVTEGTPKKKMSTRTPPSSRSRATSVTDPSFIPAGLPAHLTSKASRFSFQIAGSDSAAQEKLLEERHKQKAAQKASKEARISRNTLEGDYDDDMYDLDMDDGGFEEDIPMVGDDDYDDFGASVMSPGINAFDFTTLSLSVNHPIIPSSPGGDVLKTPRDAEGNAIGFAVSDNIQLAPTLPGAASSDVQEPSWDSKGLGLVGIQTDNAYQPPPPYEPQESGGSVGGPKRSMDDDMYFDDGMIGDQGEIPADTFDENVFDDPSHPLYERRAQPLARDVPNGLASHPPKIDNVQESLQDASSPAEKQETSLGHKPSVAHQDPVTDLRELNAYHSALAMAAQKAEAEGRFARKDSISRPPDDDDWHSSPSNSRPSLVPDEGRSSQETTGFAVDEYGMSSSFVDDYDYSDYDSALEDDPMIAAANAEALANDYEGFYGQEFGFYASAQGEAQHAYGGYFGQSGLGRSVSGRNAVREPNLTPITERSEYSTRNSFVSVNHFRDGQQPVQSPALAQLARMSPYGWPDEDPEMSMDTLMKLRKGAFGGSAASRGSSTGTSPRNSSPAGSSYLRRTASPMANYPLASSSVFEDEESGPVEDLEEEEEDEALDDVNAVPDDFSSDDGLEDPGRKESPTLQASDYNTLSGWVLSDHKNQLPHPPSLSLTTKPPPISVDTNVSSPAAASSSGQLRHSMGLTSPISTNSPMTPGGHWKPGHSRKGSATDSVAYVREHDEYGGDRWVLERRRTAESGELELVGREIVEGGRI